MRMTSAPEIPSNVTSMRACFADCTSLHNIIITVTSSNTELQNSENWIEAFDGISEGKVTVVVQNSNIKTAVQAANSNVTVTTP